MRRLNDLSGREWLRLTRTVWWEDDADLPTDFPEAMEKGVAVSLLPPRDSLKVLHPATFSEKDVGKLVKFFTKRGEVVLDPFMGVGSAGVATINLDRRFVGIELYPEWFEIAKRRLEQYAGVTEFDGGKCLLFQGDALTVMRTQIHSDSVDFIVTSPPYWNILKKADRKVRSSRLTKGLATEYGSAREDLGDIDDYGAFLEKLGTYFAEMHRVLRKRRYVAVIVMDFRHASRYYLFHADVAGLLESVGFVLQGLIVLVQPQRRLYPYGFPTAFVPNIHNSFVLIARKI